MKKLLILFLCGTLLLAGCSVQPREVFQPKESGLVATEPYADLRDSFAPLPRVYHEGDYEPGDIYTYTFNDTVVFEGSEALKAQTVEDGKNPGLGIRALHADGYTGAGVSVGIIDQPMLLEPPEFAGKIAAYYECGGYDFSRSPGSMHGPGVTSLLVGEGMGVAPGASVYYAAAPSWTGDAAYYADGLHWLVDQSEALPEAEKIRVVSVSAAPSGKGSPFGENNEQWDEAVARAEAAGIMVIDCREDTSTGFIEYGYYDVQDPENAQKVRCGFAREGHNLPTGEGGLAVPCDFRTSIEQYEPGEYYYMYSGDGGLSWGIPYAAGVLALGWQVNPALTAGEIKALLLESAYVNAAGASIIQPAAFIKAVEETLRGSGNPSF